MKKIWMSLALAASVVGSTACVPLVVGGAAVGGAIMATDRRTSGMQVEDQGIETRAESLIAEKYETKDVHVNVVSFNRKALITGEVPNAQVKAHVETIVRGVQHVRSVVNEVAVMPTASFASRAGDAAVSTRVKGVLIGDKRIDANAVKVFTERNVTYLMGLVTAEEATTVAELVSRVKGVKKVVRVFEVIDESQIPEIARRKKEAQTQESQRPRRGAGADVFDD